APRRPGNAPPTSPWPTPRLSAPSSPRRKARWRRRRLKLRSYEQGRASGAIPASFLFAPGSGLGSGLVPILSVQFIGQDSGMNRIGQAVLVGLTLRATLASLPTQSSASTAAELNANGQAAPQ